MQPYGRLSELALSDCREGEDMPVSIKIKDDKTPYDIVDEMLDNSEDIKTLYEALLSRLIHAFSQVRAVLMTMDGKKIGEESADKLFTHYLYHLAIAFLIYGKEHFEKQDIEDLQNNPDIVVELAKNIDVKQAIDEYKQILGNNDEDQLITFKIAEDTIINLSKAMNVTEAVIMLNSIITSACLAYATAYPENITVEITPSDENGDDIELTR